MANWLSSYPPTDKRPDEALIADTALPGGTAQDCEILAFTEARRRRVERLAETEAEIEQLTLERDKLRKEVAALDSLLGHETHPSPTEANPANIDQRQGQMSSVAEPDLDVEDRDEPRHSPALQESVDATIEVLREHTRPLHYREIHRKVAEMGVEVLGKDPAATLLSRFSRDPRIERVSSGTYRLIPHMVHNDDGQP